MTIGSLHAWAAEMMLHPEETIRTDSPAGKTKKLIAVLGELADSWIITTGAFVIPACAVGAPHRRERVWILAHADSAGFQRGDNSGLQKEESLHIPALLPAQGSWISERFYLPQSRICTRDDGVSRWVDRLRGLGNAVVPPLVAEIGRAIMAANIALTCAKMVY